MQAILVIHLVETLEISEIHSAVLEDLMEVSQEAATWVDLMEVSQETTAWVDLTETSRETTVQMILAQEIWREIRMIFGNYHRMTSAVQTIMPKKTITSISVATVLIMVSGIHLKSPLKGDSNQNMKQTSPEKDTENLLQSLLKEASLIYSSRNYSYDRKAVILYVPASVGKLYDVTKFLEKKN